MVQQVLTGLVGLLALLQPAIAAPASSSGSSSAAPPSPPADVRECQQDVKKYGEIYHGDDGSEYQLSCGEDHYGGDLSDARSATFLGCVPICNANPDCIGFSYMPGTCYLKHKLTGEKAFNDVDFALNLARKPGYRPSSPSSSASPITPPVSTPNPAAGSCGSISTDKYTDESNEVYTIECGRDHLGGDIGAKEGKTFVDCMGICDKTKQCIAFAWTGGNGHGTCFLKGKITTRNDNPDVSYAYKGSATHLSASASEIESISTVVSTVVVSIPTPTTFNSVVSPVTSASDSSSSSGRVLTMTVVSYSGPASPSSVSWEITSTKVHDWWHQPLDPKSHLHHTKSHHSKSHHSKSHHHAHPTGSIVIGEHPLPGITYTKYATEFTETKYVSGPAPTIPTLLPLPVDPTKVESTKPESPTPTFTEPMQQEHVGNKDFCSLIQGQPQQNLVCEVIDGAPQFDGMFVQDPDRSQSESPVTLGSSPHTAASVAIDPATGILHAWHKVEGCAFQGLNLLKPVNEHHGHHGHHRHSGTSFSDFKGTKAMEVSKRDMHHPGGLLTWNNHEFKHWLVCDPGQGQAPVLRFWAVASVAGHEWWDGDHERPCALVKLKMRNHELVR